MLHFVLVVDTKVMLNPTRYRPIMTVRFELAGGIVMEIFIGFGLFWFGAVIGGHFDSLGHLLVRIPDFARWPVGLQAAAAFLGVAAMAWAIMTSYSSLAMLVALGTKRIVMSCESDACCGFVRYCRQEPCDCGRPVNYVGNPCIPLTRAVVILVDPIIGMAFGSSLTSDPPLATTALLTSMGTFIFVHLVVICLRAHEMRRMLRHIITG